MQAGYAQSIRDLKNGYFYNLGSSGEAAADYIMERLSCTKEENSEPTVSECTSETGS